MKPRHWLIGLLLFNAVSATAGGIALMLHATGLPMAWLQPTAFSDFYFPGVILFAVVGGSAWIAALALLRRLAGAGLAGIVAGVIMLFWIVGEVVSIRHSNWLQAIYLATGLAIIIMTFKTPDLS